MRGSVEKFIHGVIDATFYLFFRIISKVVLIFSIVLIFYAIFVFSFLVILMFGVVFRLSPSPS